jgi:uncharacterized protein (TIGR02246 family)
LFNFRLMSRYPHSDPVEHIKICIARLEQAWNSKNAYLWASAFSDPCEYIDAIGIHHKQWPAEKNARLHDSTWKTIYEKSHARFFLENIELLNDHYAMVIMKAEVHYQYKGEEKHNMNSISALLQKQGAEWVIRYFQNTPYKRIAENGEGSSK